MNENEFNISFPLEEQNWELFGRMHGAVLECTFKTTETNLSLEQCKKLFLQLPEPIQNIAIDWGFNDTIFGDAVYTFVQENPQIINEIQ